MEKVLFDVMVDGRFICSMGCEYNPLNPLSIDRLVKLVTRRYPSLKQKNFLIKFKSKL